MCWIAIRRFNFFKTAAFNRPFLRTSIAYNFTRLPRGASHARLRDPRRLGATIRAVVHQGDGMKLIVDYGHEETATIELWQVVDEIQ